MPDRTEELLKGVTQEEIDAQKLDDQRRELAGYRQARQGINPNIPITDAIFSAPGHFSDPIQKSSGATIDGVVTVIDEQTKIVGLRSRLSPLESRFVHEVRAEMLRKKAA